ncbi:MAG: hypothetical protein AB1767_10670 [Bacillota bacterium]
MASASENMEMLYALRPVTANTIAAKLSASGGNQVTDPGDLYRETEQNFNFHVETVDPLAGEGKGYKVTIVVFYEAEQRHVTLTSIIRGVV